MSELRWSAPVETGLFELSRRVPGRGAYRGLTFHEIEAKTILNPVSGDYLPFNWTINPYRGCSHACVYCLSGDTLILMADGRTKPIRDISRGDRVVGTSQSGAYRRLVESKVIDHWSSIKTAYKVTAGDDTVLVASDDHRFLTDRGWKHVTGAGSGHRRRPHLTPSNRLLGLRAFPGPLKHDADYRRGYLFGMVRGDGSVGSYSYDRPGRTRGKVHRFRLALADDEALQRTKRFLYEEGIETDEFLFAPATSNRRQIRAIRTSKKAQVEAIRRLTERVPEPSGSWAAGYLAGFFDAEGSHSRGVLRFPNSDSELLRFTECMLGEFGFDAIVEPGQQGRRVGSVRLLGGMSECLRFFLTTDPAISRKRTLLGRVLKTNSGLTIRSVESLGFQIPMYDITTTTGDFIANGVVSHNCFARPTHEYLNLTIGSDFDSQIVVKTNTVELARAETAPGRWAGELIAMGTNTDPYQPAEGKYRLTRGVVEVLTERANPFSILTKSTLALRDMDLFLEAAKRTDISVNFSIGTLDAEVWRLTEPGTPHPQRRVEAVAKLNEAGVPSGVLIAPVLPGLSDHPDQIATVEEACRAAGAQSMHTIRLHLRPGVKEHFMGWLAENRPELVERYENLYRNRSYLPGRGKRRTAPPPSREKRTASQPTLPFA